MKKILAVINFWPNAEKVLRQARSVATAIQGEVHVYCPVSSEIEEMNRYVGFDNFDDVKAELLELSAAKLEQLPGMDQLESEVEWQSRPYQGVASKAEELSAELMVISMSGHSVLGDFLHRPDDWHLLRDAKCPVLVVNDEDRPYHAVVAAIDALDGAEEHSALTARILDKAVMMSEALHLPLRVVSVVPEPSYMYSDLVVIDSIAIAKFRAEAEAMAAAYQAQILARMGIKAHSAQIVVGRVETELQKVLAESGLLVIGTIANKGIKGVFVGNTCERLLRHLQGDMLVVN
jgi:universal stress protein E